MRYKHKLAYFNYMRKRERWQELFQFVDSIVEKPINYDKKQIPRIVDFYFTNAYTELVVYAEKFGLEEHRKKEVLNILFSFYLSALNSAKNAGHRNTIRGVLSENVMARALAGGDGEKKKKGIHQYYKLLFIQSCILILIKLN